jgi:chromosome segregation ATPase
MTTKKSLGNLLRNEANKPDENIQTTDSAPDLTFGQPEPTVNESPASQSSLGELKNALEQTELREAALQQEVTNLRSQLEANKQTTAKLQEEFAQAKKVILELADANSKLSQQPDTNSIISQATAKQLEDDARLAKLNSVQYGSLPNFSSESDIGSWLG